MGYVYLITNGDACKIGITENVKTRIAGIQTGSHKKIALLHSVECSNPNSLELELHKLYKAKRLSGEWFDLSSSDIYNVIAAMNAFPAEETKKRPKAISDPLYLFQAMLGICVRDGKDCRAWTENRANELKVFVSYGKYNPMRMMKNVVCERVSRGKKKPPVLACGVSDDPDKRLLTFSIANAQAIKNDQNKIEMRWI